MRFLLIAAVLGLGLCGPARAEPSAPPFAPEALFEGLVQESDVTLVFSYLREAFSSALQGREARPPYELHQRGVVIAEELKRHGVIAGKMLLDEIERSVREEMRQRPRIPRSDSRQRI